MSTPTAEELTRKKCVPCEGGVPPLSAERGRARCSASVQGWQLAPRRQADPPRVDGQELHGRRSTSSTRSPRSPRTRPPPRPPPRRLPQRRRRDLDPRHRRPLGERLHPRRQDRPGPDRAEGVTVRTASVDPAEQSELEGSLDVRSSMWGASARARSGGPGAGIGAGPAGRRAGGRPSAAARACGHRSRCGQQVGGRCRSVAGEPLGEGRWPRGWRGGRRGRPAGGLARRSSRSAGSGPRPTTRGSRAGSSGGRS